MKHIFWFALLLLTQTTVSLNVNNESGSLRSVLMALSARDRKERLSELANESW